MKNENDTYLSDWLAGKISDEQLKQMVSNEDFLAYQKLKFTLEDLSICSPNMEKNFSIVQQKLKTKKNQKVKKIFPYWKITTLAATVLLFFGLYHTFYFSNVTETTFGKTTKLTLPDNSRVSLNAKSKLSYPNLFQYNRTLKLEGEAYFEVQKGKTFTVETCLGSVKVLGTKFNVNTYKDFFEVVCYEGKVRVQSKNKFIILTPTESVRFCGDKFENWAENTSQKPQWLSGESTFKNVPLQYVMDQFKKQYKVEVDYPENVKEINFTGTFTNKNIETALKSICIPLHLKVIKKESGKIIISE